MFLSASLKLDHYRIHIPAHRELIMIIRTSDYQQGLWKVAQAFGENNLHSYIYLLRSQKAPAAGWPFAQLKLLLCRKEFGKTMSSLALMKHLPPCAIQCSWLMREGEFWSQKG
jgi:hypothetical protein